MGALLMGCTVGPDYQRPDIPVPPAWTTETEAGPQKSPPATDDTLKHWWTALDDPLLTDLIRQSLSGSLDLKTALARIEQSRAELGIVRGERYPSLDMDATYDRGLSSENSGIGSTRLSDIPMISVDPTDTYTAGLGAYWEIDLFGRIRRSVEAATADYQAAVEDYRDVRVALCADVGDTYYTICSLGRRIQIAEKNVAAQKRSLEIVRYRYEAGAAPRLELAQAESNLSATRSKLPPLLNDRVKAFNRLSVLLGKRPGDIGEEQIQNGAAPRPPSRMTIGFPADLLRRRPDIRTAERRLAAQGGSGHRGPLPPSQHSGHHRPYLHRRIGIFHPRKPAVQTGAQSELEHLRRRPHPQPHRHGKRTGFPGPSGL